VEVSINGSLIAYQGTAGSNTLETIDFTKGWVDPRDGTYFSYYLTKDRKHYQLLWFLEEEASITSLIPSPGRGGLGRGVAQAVSYDNRIHTVYGMKLGILTNDQNTPIEQAWTDLDITAATTWYIAHMTDTDILEDSMVQYIERTALVWWTVLEDCKWILKKFNDLEWNDGVYVINPMGENMFPVYCDMTTDGWGWTFFWRINNNSTGEDFFENGIGVYLENKLDNGTKYSLGSDLFKDTEMMALLDSSDPIIANNTNKIVFFEYKSSDIWFNSWPVPCSWLTSTLNYKLQIWWDYILSWVTPVCDIGNWIPYTSGWSYIIRHHSTPIWNQWWLWMWGDASWNHDGWWYLR
jgi:hypothetical protein